MRLRSDQRPRRRQRGVAVITALLLTTLAVTIVTSLFWQQQVQVRSMENQRLQLQTRWIVRGALDLSRLVLQEDFYSTQYTAIDGIWATPLEETRLDDYIERERREGEGFNATLSGRMIDAQSRYNLASLATSGVVEPDQKAVFGRLLTNLQLDASLAMMVAKQVAQSQVLPVPMVKQSSGAEPMEFARVEDLLAVSGFTPQSIERLRDFVIVLPAATKVNVNTAPAELLSALSPSLSMGEAAALVYRRKQAAFKDENDYKGQPQIKAADKQPQVSVDVKSSYFLALSRVRLDRASLDTESLLRRDIQGRASVVWIREK